MKCTGAVAFLIGVAALGLCGGTSPAQPAPDDLAALDEIQDVVALVDPSPLLIRFHVRVEGVPLRAAWAKSLQRIFKTLDRDKNGILTEPELARMPPPYLLFAGGSLENSAQVLVRTMTDQSGVRFTPPMSPDEFTKYLTGRGGRAFHIHSVARGLQNQIWLDFGGEVVIQQGYISGPRQPPSDVNDVLFKLLDTDNDGRLSARELQAGIKLLAAFDKDEDEMIAQDELMPRNPAGFGSLAFYDVGGSMRNLATAAGPLLFPLEGNGQLASQLLKRYAPQGDPTPKLDRQQIGLSAEDFARLDTNGDGSLDTVELARFGQRPPDLEFRVRLGRTLAPTFELMKRGEPGTVAAQLTRETQGLLTLQRGPTRLMFGLDSDNTPAQGLVAHFKTLFRAFDGDANGYLDKKEAAPGSVFNLLFKEMDKDGDGQLFEKEMLEYVAPWADLYDRASETCVSLSALEEGRGLFDLLDTNRDGRLSVREIRQLPKLLERFDFNKDGYLQKEELPRTFRILMRQGAQQSSDSAAGYAVVFVDAFSIDGGRSARLPELKDGPLWFRKMDRNRDGDVSRAEFLGSDEEFRRIDTDNDGLISLEEAVRFDAEMRRARK